jgi:hypothetical protein
MEPSNQSGPRVTILDGQFALADLPRLLGISATVIANAIAHGSLRLSGDASGGSFVMRSDLFSWLERRPYAGLFSEQTGEITPR